MDNLKSPLRILFHIYMLAAIQRVLETNAGIFQSYIITSITLATLVVVPRCQRIGLGRGSLILFPEG